MRVCRCLEVMLNYKDPCDLNTRFVAKNNLSVVPFDEDAEKVYMELLPHNYYSCEIEDGEQLFVHIGYQAKQENVKVPFPDNSPEPKIPAQVQYLRDVVKETSEETGNLFHSFIPLVDENDRIQGKEPGVGTIMRKLEAGEVGFKYESGVHLVVSTLSVPLAARFGMENLNHVLKVVNKMSEADDDSDLHTRKNEALTQLLGIEKMQTFYGSRLLFQMDKDFILEKASSENMSMIDDLLPLHTATKVLQSVAGNAVASQKKPVTINGDPIEMKEIYKLLKEIAKDKETLTKQKFDQSSVDAYAKFAHAKVAIELHKAKTFHIIHENDKDKNDAQIDLKSKAGQRRIKTNTLTTL
eukprot:GHVT01104662.1.p1 GENE.GHVT01104662.1~~GHVT01104662.1.p1  ORF type:complete len:354 (+),score=37.00 GHVT01104662.1:1801-2862(+)